VAKKSKSKGNGMAGENWRLAQEMAKECDRLRGLEDRAKENLAQRRKAKESQIEELMNFVRGAEAPLFDAAAGEDGDDAKPAKPAPAKGPWEKVELSQIDGMPKAALRAFNKVTPDPLVTMKDLQEFQAKHGEFWAKDLKGVGPKARQEIEDCLEAFWTAYKAKEEKAGNEVAQAAAVS
jgi:hypothetical protein